MRKEAQENGFIGPCAKSQREKEWEEETEDK
jgi:hypothetical protein